MHKNKLISFFDSTKIQLTSHDKGEKFVFFENDEMHSPVTQIAIGRLKVGEMIPLHLHNSMEEFFYILSGMGVFFIGDEKFNIYKDCCIRVPVGVLHSIKADSDLQFYYFGVAIN